MVNLCKNFMLFWQVYPKIQPDPLTIATGVYMVAGRRHYGNIPFAYIIYSFRSICWFLQKLALVRGNPPYFPYLTEGHSPEQIFNSDEPGLYYELLPGKTFFYGFYSKIKKKHMAWHRNLAQTMAI